MRDPLGTPRPSMHPGDVFLQLLCLFAGLGLLLSPEQPGALERVLPAWMTTSWAWFLILGAVTVLVGVFRRTRLSGLLTEFVGRVLLVLGATIYAASFIVVSGGISLVDTAPLLVFDVFMAWRARHILSEVGELRETLAIMTWARENREHP